MAAKGPIHMASEWLPRTKRARGGRQSSWLFGMVAFFSTAVLYNDFGMAATL